MNTGVLVGEKRGECVRCVMAVVNNSRFTDYPLICRRKGFRVYVMYDDGCIDFR